ncbi:uncharacterized protein BO97DRAFT_403464 [Aspergillus homomorphus CBS 101889]|uniref:Uncharacterized protein n=1 Tax=Aspergillus homomorphus (strain CBS 101889) TaxID=1450537 RepID=A0A395I5K0_ASPHC|nr:hypothetical protein BO97DRAFT_403464 [Aspergillus homomorphus CBS 101889]RAL15481.1 hypothetical protein BO97DRAFT_403464 [Aspergillus homomorphus CBS 101889]
MVFRMLGLQALEALLVRQLLASRTFHRVVGKVHDQVQRMKHGLPPPDTPRISGFDRLQNPAADSNPSKFWIYFKEEIQNQLKK